MLFKLLKGHFSTATITTTFLTAAFTALIFLAPLYHVISYFFQSLYYLLTIHNLFFLLSRVPPYLLLECRLHEGSELLHLWLEHILFHVIKTLKLTSDLLKKQILEF